MKKIITVYFSRRGMNYVNGSIVNLKRGNTELCAEYIQRAVGGDIFEIVADREYSADYMTCTEEAQDELRRKEQVPVKEYLDSLEDYDVIFLGYPNWWGTYPMAVDTFLKHYNLAGKEIHPFCTNEGSGMGGSRRWITAAQPGAIVSQGLAIHGAEAPHSESRVAAWAKSVVE
ncbi:MAG: NAD(P)H-dependent oxidoreductase [Muribaculaceae bacterium]|nr:NAD(P)H-dependent oxidoreductase [Muribaculaceae bacterium]